MAKSKYNPEIVQKILDVIAQTGSDRAGYEAGGISKDTFYQWINRHADFADRIKQVKSQFRETCPEVLINQAQRAFADYLFGRVEISTTTFKRGTNEKGSYSEEVTKRIRLSPPRWAIERVLGRPIDLLEAVKVLVDANVLPRWLIQVVTDEMGEARRGVTEAFAGILPENDARRIKPGLSEETAAAIRNHILGIESADSTALPEALGGGQEPNKGMREIATDRA